MPTPSPQSTHHDLSNFWSIFQSRLQSAVPKTSFNVWLRHLQPISLSSSTLYLSAHRKSLPWIKSRYAPLLSNIASNSAGRPISVSFINPPSADHLPPSKNQSPPSINPRHTFRNFVIGSSNHLAHTASLSVSESPGSSFNPLFIHSSSGLGKTHLLHSIAHYVQATAPSLSVIYTTIDSFTSNFVSSIRLGSINHFNHSFKNSDVLIVDDIQFLSNKTKTEEQFLHIISYLLDTNCQIILSSNLPPSSLSFLSQPLRARLNSGLTIDIKPPDLSTRIAILKKHISTDQIHIEDPNAIELLARSFSSDVRSLVGALIRSVAFSSLSRQPISTDLVSTVISSLYPHTTSPDPSINRIVSETSIYFNVRASDITGSSRKADFTLPRHIAMYLSRQLTSLSLPTIGSYFGGRDHSTVLHALQRIDSDIKSNSNTSQVIEFLKAKLSTPT